MTRILPWTGATTIHMKTVVIALVLLTATPAAAAPIRFEFTGTNSPLARLPRFDPRTGDFRVGGRT